MSESTDSLLAALARVADPAGGDLASSGRVSAPRVKDGVASIVLDVTGLAADARATLERRIRAAMVGIPGISDIRIAMTADKVARTIIAIGSGKGGVGKSTLSANLAIALARSGKKVGLVDADIYGPSQPRIMGNHDRPELADKQIVPVDAWGVKMLSIGQLVDAGTALAWRGPMVASALGQLMDGDWGDCDTMIVDLPPGTGDIQLTIVQTVAVDGAVIVTTPQEMALIDARKAVSMFAKVNVPILGLIENMAWFEGDDGKKYPIFGKEGGVREAKEMNVPLLGQIPIDIETRERGDSGAPVALVAPSDNKVSAAFHEVASTIRGKLPV